jgi:hypothetical protein
MPSTGGRDRSTDPAAVVAWIAAAFTLAISVVVLVGWAADLRILI